MQEISLTHDHVHLPVNTYIGNTCIEAIAVWPVLSDKFTPARCLINAAMLRELIYHLLESFMIAY